MAGTYLLTWNPAKFIWDELPEIAQDVMLAERVETDWSCGNRRTMEIGSRVFLLRQGSLGHRGIVGSGHVTKPPYEGDHFDDGESGERSSHYVDVLWDRLIDPEVAPVLPREELDVPPLDKVNWGTQCSGIVIPPDAAVELERRWAHHCRFLYSPVPLLDEDLGALEGEMREQLIRHRQRERQLRQQKIAQVLAKTGRLRCEVPGCGFDFREVYGAIGAGYAQVHHTKPLGQRKGAERTSLKDLAIVCANCHAMVHAGGQCRPMKGLIPTRQ